MNLMASITVILLGVFSFAGYKRGLIKTVLSVGCILLALFASDMVYGQVSKVIQNTTHIDETVEGKVSERIEEILNPSTGKGDITEQEEKAKKEQYWNSSIQRGKVIDKLPLPAGVKKILKDNKESDDVYKELDVTPVVEFDKYIVKMLSRIILNGIAFLITFGILLIFLLVLMSMAKILTDFPLVGWIDSLGGLALGFAKGLILVWIVYFVVTMYSSTEWGMKAYYQIEDSVWMKMINDKNILTQVLFNLTKTLF